jgi:hypothetical protein
MKVLIAVDDKSHKAAQLAKQLFPQSAHIIVSATKQERRPEDRISVEIDSTASQV